MLLFISTIHTETTFTGIYIYQKDTCKCIFISNFAAKFQNMKNLFPITFVVLFACCTKVSNAPLNEEDSELLTLLNELDECQQSGDGEKRFHLYSKVSTEYEKRNLTNLQKLYQQKMLNEAESICHEDKRHGQALMAEALQRLATTNLVEGKTDSASLNAHRAYELTRNDTLDFRAQTLLLLAQINMAIGNGDSVSFFTKEAMRIFPEVVNSDLYRITYLYGLNLQERYEEMMMLLPTYIEESGIYNKAELTRLMMFRYEDTERWKDAYESAVSLMDITDSIAKDENSQNMAKIQSLQHERQMESKRAEHEAEQAKLFFIIIIVLLLLLAASIAGLFYRRKARVAHTRELEAMRLSELAKASENQVREENIKLQKLYYEHLYAIILPILNANRGKSGHINLEESSWELIEKNTDMVLPGFTSRLRRRHPVLTNEDVRFCCLIMMRVPNALLADVYGIAPSSVAVMKQRMKKKLDSDVQNQTIENYLNQYMI